MRETWLRRMEQAVAVLAGASLPLVVTGRATTQGVLAAALLIALTVAFLRRRPPLDAGVRPVLLAGAVVAAAWLPSVILSLDSVVSLMTWGRTAAMALGAAVVWSVLARNEDDHALAIRTLVVVAAIAFPYAALRSLSNYLVTLSLKPAASAMVVLVPVLIWASGRLGGRWRWLAALAVMMVPPTVWFTASKSAMAGVLVGLGLTAAFLVATRWGIRRTALAAAVLVAALVGAASRLPTPAPLPGETPFYLPGFIDMHRQLIWRFTFDRFLERPVFGWGINQINLSPGAGANISALGQEYIPSHPHNWVIELASETGVVGLTAMVGALSWALLRLARRWVAGHDRTALWSGVTLGVFWSAGAFNFSMWATWWQLVFMLAMAMMTSGRTKTGGRR